MTIKHFDTRFLLKMERTSIHLTKALGGINLLSSHEIITYTQYAWIEPFGQLLFVLGLKYLIDNFVE